MITFDDIMKYPSQNRAVFDHIAGLCKRGQLVPYMGAGLSVFAGLPSWVGFIDDLKDRCPDKNGFTEDLMVNADEAEKQLGTERFNNIFKKTFHHDKDNAWWKSLISGKHFEEQAIAVIPALFNGPLITTNFDKIIEAVHDFHIPIAFPDDITLLNLGNKERNHVLYKVHGCVSDPENIILTKKSYQVYDNRNSELVTTLSAFFKGFSFLFLGSAIQQDRPIVLWEKLTNTGQEHFALLEYPAENFGGRVKELEEKNIHPIFFPKGKWEAIKIILDELLKLKKESILKIPRYEKPFIGRETVLNEIEQKFGTGSVVTLTGSGGVGKTRLACEYQERHKTDYSSGSYFINAVSKENIQVEFFRFAVDKRLVQEEEKYREYILWKVQIWLSEHTDWLFILNNVEHYEHIAWLLQYNAEVPLPGKRHFLITTRRQDFPQGIKVGVFKEEEATALLRSRTNKTPDTYAEEIAEALGFLPLALEQAAAYIKTKNSTYQQYVEDLQKDGILELLKKGNPEDGTLAVTATYNMALRMINREASKQLLNLCAFFAPDNIHGEWFRTAHEQLSLFPLLQKHIGKEEEYQNSLKELAAYSLVSLADNTLSIHRLTQAVVRKAIDETKNYHLSCVQILNKQVFYDFSTVESRILFNELTPHITTVTNYLSKPEKKAESAELFNFLGRGFYEQGAYEYALEWYEKALSVCEKVLGKEHPNTATTYHNIAAVYDSQGEYEYALEWYEKALVIQEKVLGKEHHDSTTTYNGIAAVYHSQGEYEYALEWYEKALVIQEKVLGKKHPTTAMTYNNIAGVYRNQGKYEKALEWCEKALVIQKKVLGKEHPDTATTYNNIAGIYDSQGKYEKALERYKKALTIQEKVLGKEHPNTATTYNNIAAVYHSQGEYKHALERYEKGLTICEKVLGKEHPDTATTYNNIALVYQAQGKYEKALEWYEKALIIQKKVLGKEHPDTATTYNNIAGVYDSQGEYEQALEWHEKALIIQKKVLAKEHPDTATTYHNIALVYSHQSEYEQALEWYEKALIIQKKVLGKEHPDTATTYNSIALVYHSQGDYEKALEWFEKALAICEKVLGKEHPDTAITYNNIAAVYHCQSEYEKALEWYEKALAIQEKVLGKDHPTTAATYNNAALVYSNQGEYEQALERYKKALGIQEKVLGKDHPNTKLMLNNMAATYEKTGNPMLFEEWITEKLRTEHE